MWSGYIRMTIYALKSGSLEICLYIYIYIYIRRKFRSQTSDNMDRWKAEQGRGREKRKIRRKKSRRERVRRKKMQMREKVGKSRNTVFFQWFVAPEGRKVGSLKRRVRSQLARWVMKKLHAVVARSTFPSQNAHNTPASDHFWKLRCRKSARRCGAKHISKSKCTKHTSFGPLLEVEMSKKCTLMWREAHFQVKMYKTPHVRAGAKHISKLKCTKHHMFAPLLEVRMLKKCTPLWREAHFQVKMLKTPGVRTTFGGSDVAALQDTTLQDITLHYTPVHCITLHYTPVHSTTLIYTTLHYITLNDTATQIDR